MKQGYTLGKNLAFCTFNVGCEKYRLRGGWVSVFWVRNVAKPNLPKDLSLFSASLGIPHALALLLCAMTLSLATAQEPIAPKEPIKLFNGKDLTGWTTWLKDTKGDDPRKVFSVEDGIIHVSGDGFGYLATAREYRDYHLSLEFKWGKRTDGRKFVRNSGVLLNAIGPDGGANGTWMSCVECQLAQGCVGDLIPIRGKNERSVTIPVAFTAEVAVGADKRPRWKRGGEARIFETGQLWWNKHEVGFKELLDTRGKDDLDSPLGEWTKIDCISRDKTLEIRVNGKTVNKAFDVFPAAGKILLQSEGFEVYFRNVELRPAAAREAKP